MIYDPFSLLIACLLDWQMSIYINVSLPKSSVASRASYNRAKLDYPHPMCVKTIILLVPVVIFGLSVLLNLAINVDRPPVADVERATIFNLIVSLFYSVHYGASRLVITVFNSESLVPKMVLLRDA